MVGSFSFSLFFFRLLSPGRSQRNLFFFLSKGRGEDDSVRPPRQSTWILKRESPSPSASSPPPIVRPSRRTRSPPPTRRSRSTSPISTGLGGRVVRLTLSTLPTPPTSPLPASTATPRKRSASSGSERTTATAAAQVSVVRSTTTKSSRSNSLGIAQYPSASVAQLFPSTPPSTHTKTDHQLPRTTPPLLLPGDATPASDGAEALPGWAELVGVREPRRRGPVWSWIGS